uniref:(northern house mosquito) hypothetical protein n=1 Tax=Culex pipiens TaxID=7175 RepID=A0A8D8KR44_CULPI
MFASLFITSQHEHDSLGKHHPPQHFFLHGVDNTARFSHASSRITLALTAKLLNRFLASLNRSTHCSSFLLGMTSRWFQGPCALQPCVQTKISLQELFPPPPNWDPSLLQSLSPLCTVGVVEIKELLLHG